jgi:DNA-binding NarL/FixJ family response regulator
MKNTILIVDDHILFREGMSHIISRWDDFEVVGEARNGQEAIEMARELMPDIILMDVTMPVLDGLQATRQINRELPGIEVVMLTMSDEEESLFEAIKNGASGYVLKDTPSRRLHDQLRGVLNNEAPLSGQIAAKIIKEFRRGHPETTGASVREPLTEREQQVLECLGEGMTNQEIADRIFLSESTVKKYLHNILEKLHLNNRVEAAIYAVREDLVK